MAVYATLIGVGGPEWGAFGKGLVSFKVPEGSLGTALAFISTNAAITAGIYATYLGKEKKWKKEDLFNGVMFTDALVHVISVILISGAIILSLKAWGGLAFPPVSAPGGADRQHKKTRPAPYPPAG